jgi:hypothetical protein
MIAVTPSSHDYSSYIYHYYYYYYYCYYYYMLVYTCMPSVVTTRACTKKAIPEMANKASERRPYSLVVRCSP